MSEALHKAAQAVLDRWDSPQWEWRQHGPTADLMAALRAALAQPPAPTAQPAAPFLFIAMDDDKRASVTWCANEAAVREAAKRAMFWLQLGEELSAEHANELDGCVEELLGSGAMHFEGDPPLYLYRVGRVAQPVQQPTASTARKLVNEFARACAFGNDETRARAGDALLAALSAAPAERQPLSDEQLDMLAFDAGGLPNSHLEFARAIEAAHNITAAPAAQKGEKL